MRRLGIGLLAAALTAGACGGGEGGGGEAFTIAECTEMALDFANGVDVSNIDVDDGIDDAERADFQAQSDAFEADHPELAQGGACDTLLDNLDPEEEEEFIAELVAQLDPDVIALLADAATEQFDQVGDTIGSN